MSVELDNTVLINQIKNRGETKKIFMIKKIKKFNFWTKEEDQLLLNIAEKYVSKNWLEISKSFEKKNSVQCSARYLKIKPGIKRGHWILEEDNLIKNNVKILGTKWSRISKLMINRTGKQIRDRYLNYLDSNFKKEKFTLEEDDKIKELYINLGSKWTKISHQISGRTPDMIKNRFYSFLKSKIHVYERRNFKFKRIWMKKQIKIKNIKEIENIKKFPFETCKLNKIQMEDKSVGKVKVFNNEVLKIANENNFEKIQIKKEDILLNECKVNQFTLIAKTPINSVFDTIREDFDVNNLEKFFENPLNLNRFTYFYLENSKMLLKNNFNRNNSYF